VLDGPLRAFIPTTRPLRQLKRRPNTVIHMEILGLLLQGPKGPTRLAQAISLNFNKFLEFASFLEERRFIRKETRDERELYFITPEGVEVYRIWTDFWTKFGKDTDLR
jgi:predicted transcriptional regulator